MVKRQAFKMGQQQPHTQDDLLELIPNDRLSAKQNELRRYVLAQHVPILPNATRILRAVPNRIRNVVFAQPGPPFLIT